MIVNMKKIIFLEGLPGVGKTTLINEIRKKKLSNIYIVDEIINENILNNIKVNEQEFLLNDFMKVNKYNDGIIIIDRGPISTLSYSETKKIMDINFDLSNSINEFQKYINIYKDSKIVYLTNKGKSYSITVSNTNSPYGTIENQKLLEEISIYNSKKYCENTIVLEYFKNDMEAVINEIIN